MNLNLDNFEVEEFARDTPFVLTSPTSLQACSELDIEPIELVYKSLEHFEEVCCHLPLSQIYRIYEEAETERQGKLIQCRELRKALLYQKMTIANYGKKNNDSPRQRRSAPAGSGGDGTDNRNRRNVNSQSVMNNNTRSRSAADSGSSGSIISSMKKKKSASATSVNKVNFQRNDLQSTRSASTSRENNNKNVNSSRRGRGNWRGSSSANASYYYCTSDTESNEGTLHITPNCENCGDNIPMSSRSVPDLSHSNRGNLDFRKVASSAWSPTRRHYCLCHLDLRDRDILPEYFKRYDDILSSPAMSEEDRKIMERLILKRAKMLEWERQSQELREIIELDRMKKYRTSQILAQQWKDKLAEKRQAENMENHRRYLRMQEKLQRQQKDLETYLEERDKRIQRYLEDLSFKKKQSILEKQKLEALRQLEVSKAIEKLLEEDKQRRETMRDRLQKRMTEAEIRKQRRERDYWRHVSEMNRLEDIKRALKVEKVEQQARASVEELRHQIEEKEHKARLNQLRHLHLREKMIESGSGRHQQQIEKARKIHEELLRGFDEWNKKALQLHLNAQERADLKHLETINRRRARAASERILREERTTEMLKRVHEMEEKRKELMKNMIQSKDMKSQRHKAEKERSINISRIRAQQAAELRQQLKEKLNPETFDKKAARAEIEMRVLKKRYGENSNFTVKLNPRLLTKRCSSCKCYHPRMNNYRNGSLASSSGTYCSLKSKCCNGKDKKRVI